MEYPYIAVVTPTKNRREHLEFQVEQMKEQTYPIDRIKWIITDSSDSIDTSWNDIIYMYPNIIYKKLGAETTLGASRNIGLTIVTGLSPKPEFILFMDDDDIVHKDRFVESVNAMLNNPSYNVGGCSNVFLFLVKNQDLIEIGSFSQKYNYKIHHALEPTLIVKYEYNISNFFDDLDPKGLLVAFLNNWQEPILELDPKKTCLIIGHDSNTFDKYQIIKEENKNKFNIVNYYKGYGMKQIGDDWLVNERLIEMFRVIHYEYL